MKKVLLIVVYLLPVFAYSLELDKYFAIRYNHIAPKVVNKYDRDYLAARSQDNSSLAFLYGLSLPIEIGSLNGELEYAFINTLSLGINTYASFKFLQSLYIDIGFGIGVTSLDYTEHYYQPFEHHSNEYQGFISYNIGVGLRYSIDKLGYISFHYRYFNYAEEFQYMFYPVFNAHVISIEFSGLYY